MYQKAELPKPVSLSDQKTVEGFYLGSESIKIEGHERESIIHAFENVKDLGVIQIWGFDLLNRYLENIPKEVLTKVVYKGKVEKDDKSAHQCEVYYDTDKKRPADRKLPF